MNKAHTLRRPPKQTPVLYAQEGLGDRAMVYAHYFLPGTGADWYVTEYDPEEDIIFGWAELIPGCGEWGYTSVAEIERLTLRVPMMDLSGGQKFHLPSAVELDRHWEVRTMREALANR